MLYHVIPMAMPCHTNGYAMLYQWPSQHCTPAWLIPCHQPIGRSLTTVATRAGNAFWARKVSGVPWTCGTWGQLRMVWVNDGCFDFGSLSLITSNLEAVD